MHTEVMTRFRIRRRPYVAKSICANWRQRFLWGPGYYGMPQPVPGASDYVDHVDKDTVKRVYLLSVALYKHWLEIILKFNIAYYFLTGAMISFYFAKGLQDFSGFALVLPMAIGIAAIVYAGHCVAIIKNTADDVKKLKTNLDAREVLDMGYVADLLRWTSKGFVIVVIGLSVLVLVCFIKTGTYREFFKIFTTG